MGVSGLGRNSHSIHDQCNGGDIYINQQVTNKTTVKIQPGNPNPYNFKVIKVEVVKCFVVAMINYPDCHNYEGNKVCVFDCDLEDLFSVDCLDPHFTDKPNVISPIARFEPTELGYRHAVDFVKRCV